MRRLVAMLTESAGDLPVELSVRARGGRVERLALPGVAAAAPLLPRIRALLGVLGEVGERRAPAPASGAGARIAGRGAREPVLAVAR